MHSLKSGKYYVGDPCYIFDASWDKAISDTSCFESEVCELFGKQVYCGGTAYGDGLYTDNFGREYAVDAGLIGILPIEMIEIDKHVTLEEIEKSDIMHVVDFDKDFKVWIEDGIFHFGDIVIDTKEDDEEEEIEDDDESDEEEIEDEDEED